MSVDVVLAVARAPMDNEFIADTLIGWYHREAHPGFENAPREVTELHRISNVVRTADRWGPAPEVSNAQLPGQVSITNLSNGSVVTETTTIIGEYHNSENDVWVLVYPAHGRWYPQSELPCAGIHTQQADGRWQVPAKFGEDEAKTFDVVVVLADREASEYFDAMQKLWCRAGYYRGLLTIELPQGIQEKARVRVYRE